MAKLSKVLKNRTRRKVVARYAERRSQLKAIIKSVKSTTEEIDDAYVKLRALPRDSSATRVKNRCRLTGRPRGYLRKFGMCRIAFRDLSLAGEIPGVIKSSW